MKVIISLFFVSLLLFISMSLLSIIAGFALIASLALLVWIKDKTVLLWLRLVSKVSINDIHIHVNKKDDLI